MISTRESLLGRLKAEDAHEAWKEFYELYWGAIIRYAQKLGLNQHQAEEVLQETMVALMRILPGFAYDRRKGKFRNFLLTIVHRKALAALRRAARRSGTEVPWEQAGKADIAEDGQQLGEPDAGSLGRWQDSLLEEALRRVREDVRLGERTFAVFEDYVIRRRPVEEVATRFGIKENAVYQIRNRLLRRVQGEVALLMRNSGTTPEPSGKAPAARRP